MGNKVIKIKLEIRDFAQVKEIQKLQQDMIGPALQDMATRMLMSIQRDLMGIHYSEAAKRALASSLKVRRKSDSVVLITTSPAFESLVLGRKRRQMVWLQKARAPIPIVLDDGRVIFRNATAKSMMDGHWIHPGYASTGIVERTLEEVKKGSMAMLKRQVRRELRRIFKK